MGLNTFSYIVNYQQEYENIALDQLKERYYEPNLLAKVLGAVAEPLRNVGAFDQVDLFPKANISLRGQSLEVQLTPRNGGIGRVALYAGDKEIENDVNPGRQRTLTVDLRKYAAFFPAGKPMPLGVVTWNEDDWLYSRKVSLEYTAPKPLQGLTNSTRLFALCIGTSNYADEGFDLAFADLDAEKVALAVREAGKSLLLDDPSRVSVRILSTAKSQQDWPSKPNIRRAMEEIAAIAKPEDVFILYLSGHGTTNDRDGHDYFYYLTYELNSGNINDTDIRRQYAISTKEFAEASKVEWD